MIWIRGFRELGKMMYEVYVMGYHSQKRGWNQLLIPCPVFNSNCHIKIPPNTINSTRFHNHGPLYIKQFWQLILVIHLVTFSWSLRETSSQSVYGEQEICYEPGLENWPSKDISVMCYISVATFMQSVIAVRCLQNYTYGANASLLVQASQLVGIKPNHIYITNDCLGASSSLKKVATWTWRWST